MDEDVSKFHLWGGLLETLESCEKDEKDENITESNSLLKKLKENLTLLENSKSFEEIATVISHFSEENINYLNSPLLDEIWDTMKSPNPLLCCCAKNKGKALDFYNERHLVRSSNEILVVTCIKGHTNIAKFLLNKLVKTDNLDKALLGVIDSCFLYVCMYGHEELLKIFLEYKFGYTNSTAFYLACSNGHKNILEILMKEFPGSAFLNCTLVDAAKNGHAEVIELLLINKIYKGWATALQDASQNGYEKIVENLLKYRLFAPRNDHTVSDALKYAAGRGHAGIVKLLIENNDIDINLDDTLKIACKNGYRDAAEVLIKHGANINLNWGYIECIMAGNFVGIMELFLKHGLSHEKCLSALSMALGDERIEIAKVLIKHGVSIQSFLKNNYNRNAIETLMKCL